MFFLKIVLLFCKSETNKEKSIALIESILDFVWQKPKLKKNTHKTKNEFFINQNLDKDIKLIKMFYFL